MLRPISADDLDRLVELDSDPAVMRHLTGGEPTPAWVYHESLMERMLGYGRTDPRLGVFAIECLGDFLGWVMLRPDHDQPEWLEIGYRLRRSAWGQGIATWAAELMRRRALFDIGVDTVCARTTPDNFGSRRVMEKIGLRYQGEFFFEGRVFGNGLYIVPAVTGVIYTQTRAEAGHF